MRFAPYQANTVFVVSETISSISHRLRIYREHGHVVGTVYIGDDPEDFKVITRWGGYEPVVEWVSKNWRNFHKSNASVQSILGIPALKIQYDEE